MQYRQFEGIEKWKEEKKTITCNLEITSVNSVVFLPVLYSYMNATDQDHI